MFYVYCWFPPLEYKLHACICDGSLQSCPALCNSMDCNPLGSSVHGISQAGILEWVVIPFTRGSSQCRDQTLVSTLQADSLPSEPPVGAGIFVWLVRACIFRHTVGALLKEWMKKWTEGWPTPFWGPLQKIWLLGYTYAFTEKLKYEKLKYKIHVHCWSQKIKEPWRTRQKLTLFSTLNISEAKTPSNHSHCSSSHGQYPAPGPLDHCLAQAHPSPLALSAPHPQFLSPPRLMPASSAFSELEKGSP